MHSLILKRSYLSAWVKIAGVLLFATLTAISARINVWLPFSPVPLTLQTLVVVLSGFVLGSKRGALAMFVYLQAVLLGMPATASALGGPAALLGPTAGYLWSFPVAAFVAGWLDRQITDQRLIGHALGGVAALAVIYLIGVAWLSGFVGGWAPAWKLGVVPFILADLAKVLLATATLSVRRR
jgi:biotin transport system substrate-specific component